MPARYLLAALLLLLTLAGCNAARPTATATPPPPAPTAAPTPTPPATTTPTESFGIPTPDAIAVSFSEVSYGARSISALAITNPDMGAGAASPYQHTERTVEEALEEGHLLIPGESPVHIAFRGITEPNSTRCVWLGVARTPEQREWLIRNWFGLDEDAPLPSADEVVRQTLADLGEVVPAFRDTLMASVRAMAYGGVSTDYTFLTCYVDYRVSEYLLGTGAPTIPTAYHIHIPGMSYELYQAAHAAGRFDDEPLLSKALHEEASNQLRIEYEKQYTEILQGRESVVFLAPMGAYQAIAIEAWLVAEQWDVQLVDGVLQAVRYGAGDHDPEYRQPLAGLKSRITTAAASDQFAGKRIASTEGLEAYYREIGAYDDITPGDGLDNPFTPAQPPPVPPCATGGAVADPGANPHQVHDCQALLAAQDALGAAALNWSPTLPLPIWDGVTMDGPDGSVVKLDLSGKGLAGRLPPELGWLFGLEELRLRNNRLTGPILPELGLLGGLRYLVLDGNQLSGAVPPELGELPELEGLRLSGNNLTGCLPACGRWKTATWRRWACATATGYRRRPPASGASRTSATPCSSTGTPCRGWTPTRCSGWWRAASAAGIAPAPT